MITILDMTNVFSVFYLFLFITSRCCMGQYLFLLFMPGNCIDILFCQNGTVHRHNGCNLFMIQYNV